MYQRKGWIHRLHNSTGKLGDSLSRSQVPYNNQDLLGHSSYEPELSD